MMATTSVAKGASSGPRAGVEPSDGRARAGFAASDELAGVCDIIRQHGFDLGYHQAVSDQLAALVPMVEDYLRRTQASTEQRQYVYGLVARLETALLRGSPLVSEGFISGEGI